MMARTEFGYERTSCDCTDCQRFCRFMPGMLIPADLARLIPAGSDPFEWAEKNLVASPGSRVLDFRTMAISSVGTLVPATKADGSCINYTADGHCAIHENAPFGCAFFDAHMDDDDRTTAYLTAIRNDEKRRGLYYLIWNYLKGKGLVGRPVAEKRAALKADSETLK
jgi:hypothetical protein